MGAILTSAIDQIKHEAPGKPAQSPAQIVIGFFVFMAALALFFWILEGQFPEDPTQKPVSLRNTRPGWRADFIYWILGRILDRIIGLLVLPAAIAAVLLRAPHLQTVLARQPIALQVLEVLLVADFAGYWMHRLLHRGPRLWRIHAVHHSSPRLDWLAAGRVHPGETILTKLVQVSVVFWMGFALGPTAALGPFLGIYAIMLHANVRWDFGPLRWVIASPAFHRWHHSADAMARDKNFAALFPAWDLLFGTAYFPVRGKPAAYGIDEPFPARLPQQLLWPFQPTSQQQGNS
ncbi:MAG: sterol desaturase family protein [Bryobacteraceae bacterium]